VRAHAHLDFCIEERVDIGARHGKVLAELQVCDVLLQIALPLLCRRLVRHLRRSSLRSNHDFHLYQVYFGGVEMVNHRDERFVIYVVPGADERQHSFRRYRAVAAALLVSVAVLALAAVR
jgi:hypothetical protein